VCCVDTTHHPVTTVLTIASASLPCYNPTPPTLSYVLLLVLAVILHVATILSGCLLNLCFGLWFSKHVSALVIYVPGPHWCWWLHRGVFMFCWVLAAPCSCFIVAYYELGAFICFVLCIVSVFRGTVILCIFVMCMCVFLQWQYVDYCYDPCCSKWSGSLCFNPCW
jgi:hypothetical protein